MAVQRRDLRRLDALGGFHGFVIFGRPRLPRPCLEWNVFWTRPRLRLAGQLGIGEALAHSERCGSPRPWKRALRIMFGMSRNYWPFSSRCLYAKTSLSHWRERRPRPPLNRNYCRTDEVQV